MSGQVLFECPNCGGRLNYFADKDVEIYWCARPGTTEACFWYRNELRKPMKMGNP